MDQVLTLSVKPEDSGITHIPFNILRDMFDKAARINTNSNMVTFPGLDS